MKIGNRVRIMWSKTANCDGYVEEEAEFRGLPQGEGDTIHLMLDDGTEMHLNPYHPYFIGLKEVRENE